MGALCAWRYFLAAVLYRNIDFDVDESKQTQTQYEAQNAR